MPYWSLALQLIAGFYKLLTIWSPIFGVLVIHHFFFYSNHQAVYGTLFEAEHRSTFYIPYWNLPLARWIVPRQRKFQADLKVINDCLDELIKNAKETRQVQYTW